MDWERVAARLGLEYEGPCPGGEVGAAFVRHGGRPAVLSEGTEATVPVIAIARDAGLPVAEYLLVANVDGRSVVVQERLPGRPPGTVDRALVEQMIALNERCAGIGPKNTFPLFLRSSGPGFCLREPVAAHSARGVALLDWARSLEADELPGDDLVHADFHPGNVLVDAGRITGVVDWDNAGRGDRRFGLVTLRYDLELRAPALAAELDARLRAELPAGLLRLCWAHLGIRLVDWSIRHHDPAGTERWLRVAESGYGI